MAVSLVALSVALGGTAYAATGGTFVLGRANTAASGTTLTSGLTTAPALTVTNTGGKPAAKFISNAGVPAIQVTNEVKIPKLNADRLDGLDATDFAPAGIATSAVHAPAANSSSPTMTFADMIGIEYLCPATLTSPGILRVGNGSATPGAQVNIFISSDGMDTAYLFQSENTRYGVLATATGDSFIIQAHGYTGILVINVATVNRPWSNDCHVQAQGVIVP